MKERPVNPKLQTKVKVQAAKVPKLQTEVKVQAAKVTGAQGAGTTKHSKDELVAKVQDKKRKEPRETKNARKTNRQTDRQKTS